LNDGAALVFDPLADALNLDDSGTIHVDGYGKISKKALLLEL
jgi:hypothetical protein